MTLLHIAYWLIIVVPDQSGISDRNSQTHWYNSAACSVMVPKKLRFFSSRRRSRMVHNSRSVGLRLACNERVYIKNHGGAATGGMPSSAKVKITLAPLAESTR